MRQPTIVVRGDVLSSWLTVSDYTKSRLARGLGGTRGRISQLLTSREEPSAHLIAKLLLLTRLPFQRLFQLSGADGARHLLEESAARRSKSKGNGASRQRASRVAA